MLALLKKTWQPDGLEVAQSRLRGHGVFANKPFRKGETVEVAPAILLTPADKALLAETDLYNHYFITGNAQYPAAVGLGCASLYNHSYAANAVYEIDLKRKCIIVKAYKNIAAGEEVTINYNGKPDDPSPVYFNEAT